LNGVLDRASGHKMTGNQVILAFVKEQRFVQMTPLLAVRAPGLKGASFFRQSEILLLFCRTLCDPFVRVQSRDGCQ
jgi:hypothetical protein